METVSINKLFYVSKSANRSRHFVLARVECVMKIGLALAALFGSASGCSTICVGKLASTDGSVFTTHSDDGEGNPDPRIVMVR